MAYGEKLPWELIEEILSRVPPKSLVRLRTVCKRWNALFDDKTFINNHKATFRFILATQSKIYSVSIDPKIEVRELTLDIPNSEYQKPESLVDSNGFLLCGVDEGAVVWNPWLNQTRRIQPEVNQASLEFQGIGYEYDLKGGGYKTLACDWRDLELYPTNNNNNNTCWYVHDFASDEWKDLGPDSDSEEEIPTLLHNSSGVSLNGILYWVAFYDRAEPLYHLLQFDFSTKEFPKFCDLPCGVNHDYDALVLKVFREDLFSLLKQCHKTKKIEVWVTKNKINYKDGGDVVWMKFMTFSIPNFLSLVPSESCSQPSYFINDKRLVVCSCNENGRAWIYVAEDNKLISKVQLDSVLDSWPLHCSYFPNLIPVPQGKVEEAGFQPKKEAQ